MTELLDRARVWGATQEQWYHLAHVCGLRSDLLPVVSDPNVPISARSSLKEAGKVPSQVSNGHVVGMPGWTNHLATESDLAAWSRRGYGICIQTRRVRAIDVDVHDLETARQIDALIPAAWPRRRRSNSTKFLVAVWADDQRLTKRRRVLANGTGIVELLADGQQFIAVGTHPSGVPYEWDGGLPDAFPRATCAELLELLGVDK